MLERWLWGRSEWIFGRSTGQMLCGLDSMKQMGESSCREHEENRQELTFFHPQNLLRHRHL